VVKLHSYTITHKTDVGGVQLNLHDGDAVSRAFRLIQFFVSEKPGIEHFQGVTVQPMIKLDGYELIVGSSLDSQFGPVMLFGTGGQLVEVFRDRALALPPLNSTLARRMMEQTRIFKALEQLPGSAIRPYPVKLVSTWKMKDGNEVMIRPIRPEDEPLMIRFHEKLSERSVYLRYFQPLKLTQRTAHERLTRICFIDYNREMALVAERKNKAGEPELLAIGRLSKIHGRDEGELAAVAIDDAQHKGLGTELYRRLIKVAKEEKLKKLISVMLPENREMRALCTRLGFKMHADIEDNMIRAELDL